MEIDRILKISDILENKSYFLFGPRQTGKSWLINNNLINYKVYNLLKSTTFKDLSFNPALIREELQSHDKIIIIDEIQKLPEILDEVQVMIEENKINFLLTGSSARKLKKAGTNLLGGRARVKYLHPFIKKELKEHFDLHRAINFSLIPGIYFSNNIKEDLDAYIGTYLKEEIAAESLTRNLPAFSRFLEVAAISQSEILNYSKISSDAQVARSTVSEYFQILKDTLIAYEINNWKESIKRKPIERTKFYFFDYGIARYLQKAGEIRTKSPLFGKAFESYIFHELKTFCDYNNISDLSFWRSINGDEVDFILNNKTAIEVKGKDNIDIYDLKGLKALKEEGILSNYLIVSLCDRPKTITGYEWVKILPYSLFLDQLWNREYD